MNNQLVKKDNIVTQFLQIAISLVAGQLLQVVYPTLTHIFSPLELILLIIVLIGGTCMLLTHFQQSRVEREQQQAEAIKKIVKESLDELKNKDNDEL